jgi:hypothetical protein
MCSPQNYYITYYITACYKFVRAGMKDVYIRYSNKKRRSGKMKALSKTWEKLFTAVTFAEAGEFESARQTEK